MCRNERLGHSGVVIFPYCRAAPVSLSALALFVRYCMHASAVMTGDSTDKLFPGAMFAPGVITVMW